MADLTDFDSHSCALFWPKEAGALLSPPKSLGIDLQFAIFSLGFFFFFTEREGESESGWPKM